jgi:hypothetical protein
MSSKRTAKISDKSQGGKTVPCVRCKGDIQPYAGRAVSLIGSHYAHHPGQCADRGARESAMHQTAQLELFAWSCAHVEPSYTGNAPAVCDVAGSDRAEYVEHMRGHGKRMLSTEPMIKLRKTAPAAPRQTPRVPAFKRITWTVRHYADWQPGIGNERLADTNHVGQFWANGAEPNTVIVIEDRRRAGLPNRLVTLYLNGDGSLTADWSEAKSSRREANRIAKYAAA